MKKSEALRTLGLSDGASDDEIKAAHRKKVIENHPDKFAQDSGEYAKAEEKTKLINEARDVLLSRKWEPEYVRRDPYANPYGNPYSNPYGGGSSYPGQRGKSGSPVDGSGNPYEGWPFGGEDQTTWVWTSWDGVGGQEGSPFDPFNPFGAQAVPQKSREELKAEAKKNLRTEALVIAAKIAGVVIFALFGLVPTGLFLYVMVSLLYGLWKRLGGCLIPFFVPVALVLTPLVALLIPPAGAMTFALGAASLLCFIFDINNIRQRYTAYRNI